MALRSLLVCFVLFALACQPSLKSISVTPVGYSVEAGVVVQARAVGHYSDGKTKDLSDVATWTSATPLVASIDATHLVRAVGEGTTSISAAADGVTGTTTLTVTPRQSFSLPSVGLYVQFEEPGMPAGYWSGDTLHQWATIAPVVGAQLDVMQSFGVNRISFELRATAGPDGAFVPPDCPEGPPLGLAYPNPAASDLTNLGLLLDELHKRGMKMYLRLVNTHMEEQPPTNNQAWLTPILKAVGRHPALDVVLFEGAQLFNPLTNQCNAPAEPPLWTGPTMPEAKYVQWAIALGMSLGIPARKLSAECIVGDFNTEAMAINTTGQFTDDHFWPTVITEKTIFDNLNIPAADRTYALSMYEHSKCVNVFAGLTCTDEDPQTWADETLAGVVARVGSGPRIVAPEFGGGGAAVPVSTEHAYEGLMRLFAKYGVEGGSFWRWTSFATSEDTDPMQADPIKRRGRGSVYNPVQKVLLDRGGWHLPAIANGSFELGGATPDGWTVTGGGSGTRYDLSAEMGGPEVPWRGTQALRLQTGGQPDAALTATSAAVAVKPAIRYTTTANLRFTFADASPTATITIAYLRSDGKPSAIRASDVFTFHGGTATGFGTFPVQWIAPDDAAEATVQVGVSRNGSSQPAILDVDDVR